MECPKCGAEIDKSTIVCPNCKKVLKIICPDCKTINSKNICKKCGKVLVTKCVKCGKINLTKNKNCVKCGYSTDISGVKAESNTDKFAVLRIDFPNSDVVKAKLGSNQLYQKFKANLDVLIANYLASLNLRRQIYNNETYIVRFNKDYTLSASANSAILASIEIINIIAKLNFKLMEKKNVALKCNFTIMQRDAEQNPYDIDSKFHANMVYQNTDKDKKILDAFQLITDESFLEFYQNTYQMESLNSALVDGEMKRFFEIDVKKHINIADLNKIKISNQNAQELPSYIKNALIDQEKLSKDAMQDEKLYLELEKLARENQIEVFKISAATGEGIKELFIRTSEILKTLPKEEIEGLDKKVVYTLKEDREEFKVEIINGEYIVKGPAIDRLMARVNVQDNESLAYFQKVLEQIGVNTKLKEMQIKEGDTIRLNDWEFEWYD